MPHEIETKHEAAFWRGEITKSDQVEPHMLNIVETNNNPNNTSNLTNISRSNLPSIKKQYLQYSVLQNHNPNNSSNENSNRNSPINVPGVAGNNSGSIRPSFRNKNESVRSRNESGNLAGRTAAGAADDPLRSRNQSVRDRNNSSPMNKSINNKNPNNMIMNENDGLQIHINPNAAGAGFSNPNFVGSNSNKNSVRHNSRKNRLDVITNPNFAGGGGGANGPLPNHSGTVSHQPSIRRNENAIHNINNTTIQVNANAINLRIFSRLCLPNFLTKNRKYFENSKILFLLTPQQFNHP